MLHTISRHESYAICAAASVGGSAPCAARRQSSHRKRRRNCRPLRLRGAGALQRDLPSDIWRDPIGHSPTSSRKVTPSSVNFPNFCIVGEETHGLASRLQRQCGRKPKPATPRKRRGRPKERDHEARKRNPERGRVGLSSVYAQLGAAPTDLYSSPVQYYWHGATQLGSRWGIPSKEGY